MAKFSLIFGVICLSFVAISLAQSAGGEATQVDAVLLEIANRISKLPGHLQSKATEVYDDAVEAFLKCQEDYNDFIGLYRRCVGMQTGIAHQRISALQAQAAATV